jgi:hypothetical protein
METATIAMGYGKLFNAYDIRHGGGTTDTGCNVWLPIMCDPNNNWYNMYNNNDDKKKELIIQIANKEQAKNDWRMRIFPGEATHVIVRFNFDEIAKNYEFEYIGEYCSILAYKDEYTSISAKFGSSFAGGNVLISRDKKMTWMSGFASSEEEAMKRFDELAGKTLRILREL